MEETQESIENERYRVLSNGAVYDNTLKKIVKGATLTSDGARALVEKRVERRREVVKESANSHRSAKQFVAYSDLAFLAAITQTAMTKATNPADPKAIEAARWLQENTGESDIADPSESAASELRGLVREIADMARAITSARAAAGESDY